MGRCHAPDCKPEEGDRVWAARIGLELRPGEGLKEHAARCLAFMSVCVGRRIDTEGMVHRMAKAARVDETTMQAAIDERRAWMERDRDGG